ncbi:hypothetical protein [Deinococcus sp.]|uniref:hypothetical protein n=1 Tax=Deinococcus sp. TaxID=47478 RepID=UPI0025BC1D73|nr:hypothetical protein [Deinococcus sp.]
MDIEKLIQQQKDRLKTDRDDRSRAVEESDSAPQLDLQAALRWYYGQKTKRALTVVIEALARELRPAVSKMNEQLKDYRYEIDIQTAEFTSLLDARNGKTYDDLKRDRQSEINNNKFEVNNRIKVLGLQEEQRPAISFPPFDTSSHFGSTKPDNALLNSSEHARMIAAELHRLQEAPAREAAAKQQLQAAYIELDMYENLARSISRPALPTIQFTFRKSQKLIWKFSRKVDLLRKSPATLRE